MTPVLCLTDRNGRDHALIGLRDGALAVLAATEHGSDLVGLATFLKQQGVEEDGAKLAPDHPNYLKAIGRAFRARRHDVMAFDAERARTWFLVSTLPLGDETLRENLLRAIPNFKDEEITELLSELETTATELAAIDRRLAKDINEL